MLILSFLATTEVDWLVCMAVVTAGEVLPGRQTFTTANINTQ